MEGTATDQLEKDIQESIKKHLPQQVGDALKLRLKKADKDEEALIVIKQQLETERAVTADLRKQVLERQALEQAQLKLAVDLSNLETRERNLKVTLLELEVKEANRRADVAKELVGVVFKNRNYTTIEQHNGMTDSRNFTTDGHGGLSSYSTTVPTTNRVDKKVVDSETLQED